MQCLTWLTWMTGVIFTAASSDALFTVALVARRAGAAPVAVNCVVTLHPLEAWSVLASLPSSTLSTITDITCKIWMIWRRVVNLR